MQTKKLKDITEIILGYTFRKSIVQSNNGNYSVILAKDINNETPISTSSLSKINLKTLNPTALIKPNDILLSSRGIFKAAVFNDKTTNIIAASSIFILRPTSKDILPEYLSILLNSSVGQTKIQKIITGSSIKTILKSDLENIDIEIPSLENQKTIIEIIKNLSHQEKILEEKISLNKKLTKSILQKLLTK